MPKLIILQGIPNSGKSRWAEENESYNRAIVCRDEIRMELFNLRKYNDYTFSKENEKKVTEQFNKEFDAYLSVGIDIILDNTNLKYHYLLLYIEKARAKGYEVEFKKFPISLWKAQYRNIVRWITTGKYIPWKVMKDMQKNYKKLK